VGGARIEAKPSMAVGEAALKVKARMTAASGDLSIVNGTLARSSITTGVNAMVRSCKLIPPAHFRASRGTQFCELRYRSWVGGKSIGTELLLQWAASRTRRVGEDRREQVRGGAELA